MSVCVQNGQTEEDSGSEEVTATAAAAREIYKEKTASKVVRVLTVLAYLLSVSLAAILLSVYYVCVWKSPELPLANHTGGGGPGTSARIGNLTDYQPRQHVYNHTRGSDSTVNTVETTESPGNINITEDIDTTYNTSTSSSPYSDETTSTEYTDEPFPTDDTGTVT